VQLTAEGSDRVFIVDLFRLGVQAAAVLQTFFGGDQIKVFHNAKFDLKFLRRAGMSVAQPVFDTMLASQLLTAGYQVAGHGLEDLAKQYLGLNLQKGYQMSDWSGDLTDEQLEYAAQDAMVLPKLRAALIPLLVRNGLINTAKLEFDCLAAVVDMELNGMRLDIDRWKQLTQQLQSDMEKAASELQSMLREAIVGEVSLFGAEYQTINLDSTQQVLDALRSLGVPAEGTSRAQLAPLAGDYPVVAALLNYRDVAKKVQAFAESLPSYANPVTGRIHPTYHQLGASTGRFSCSDPNLQQIPRGAEFRSCFIPDDGHKMVIADYSQIELRVAAEISKDVRMIAAYQQGQDLHRLTASLVTGKPIDEVTGDERQAAKAVNFGLIYAMGAAGLRAYARNTYGVEMTLEQAETFRSRFFNAYRGLERWHRAVSTSREMSTRTLGGRLRQWRTDPPLTGLLNTPVQGTAADVVKKALAMLANALSETGVRIIGSVHDEIILEAPEAKAEWASSILKSTMEQAGRHYLTLVPVIAEVVITDSWAEK
jgi:DNA polymerase I-like protein with 3'-5' exonuclease and polymerase domains